jgi:O-antigen/teichoic acid export membrane protein
MTDPPSPPAVSPEAPEEGHARRLASGSLAQQASQITGLLTMLAIVTVLARKLPLAEFGVYGLLSSLAGYLLVIQNAAAGAAIKEMSAAIDPEARSRAFSTAILLYAGAGAATGLLVAAVGLVLSVTVDLSSEVQHQAQLGSVALGLVTAVGWPTTIYRDALRAAQQFVRVAAIEIVGLLAYGGLLLGLTFGGASLWVLIAASGTIPLFAGAGCALAAWRWRSPYGFSRSSISRDSGRDLLRLAGYVSLTEAAGAVIYALDRVILGLFRNAATVGLYEGPVRAHNLVRSLNSAVTVTVLPAATRYRAEGDLPRLRELVLRGFRYTLALVVPLTVVGMVLSGPILEVWLGEEFRQADTAMAILLSYWLVTGALGVASAILVGAGRARDVARYAWSVALANLVLSLALTPSLGLEGVTLGTAIPYLTMFPLMLRMMLAETSISIGELARRCWLPVYSTGVVLAAVLVVLRLTLPLDTLAQVSAVAVGGALAYWVAFYLVWFDSNERRLVKDLARGVLPRS